MDTVLKTELIPLGAAAAIAWGYLFDYPALKLDGRQLDEQLRRMEQRLRGLMRVYGECPAKVSKSDLYQTIRRLRPEPVPLEWWTVLKRKPRERRAGPVRYRQAPERRRAA